MLFDDTYVLDEKLADLIKNHANGKAKVLINDCCYSGTIWDIPIEPEKMAQFPPNIICMSTASVPSKQ